MNLKYYRQISIEKTLKMIEKLLRDVKCEGASMAWAEVEVVVHKMSIDLQLMDYRLVNKCLAIEHKCLRDFVSKHSVMVMKLPSRGKVCFDRERDYHPNFDCVHE